MPFTQGIRCPSQNGLEHPGQPRACFFGHPGRLVAAQQCNENQHLCQQYRDPGGPLSHHAVLPGTAQAAQLGQESFGLLRWQRLFFARVLLFSLTLPSDWIQDVPARYESRHVRTVGEYCGQDSAHLTGTPGEPDDGSAPDLLYCLRYVPGRQAHQRLSWAAGRAINVSAC